MCVWKNNQNDEFLLTRSREISPDIANFPRARSNNPRIYELAKLHLITFHKLQLVSFPHVAVSRLCHLQSESNLKRLTAPPPTRFILLVFKQTNTKDICLMNYIVFHWPLFESSFASLKSQSWSTRSPEKDTAHKRGWRRFISRSINKQS